MSAGQASLSLSDAQHSCRHKTARNSSIFIVADHALGPPESASECTAGSAAEQHMHALLVEDKLAQQQSYVDWMTQLHKTVAAKA